MKLNIKKSLIVVGLSLALLQATGCAPTNNKPITNIPESIEQEVTPEDPIPEEVTEEEVTEDTASEDEYLDANGDPIFEAEVIGDQVVDNGYPLEEIMEAEAEKTKTADSTYVTEDPVIDYNSEEYEDKYIEVLKGEVGAYINLMDKLSVKIVEAEIDEDLLTNARWKEDVKELYNILDDLSVLVRDSGVPDKYSSQNNQFLSAIRKAIYSESNILSKATSLHQKGIKAVNESMEKASKAVRYIPGI